jgi:hypothetical protein
MARGINGGDPHCGERAVYAAKGRRVSAVIRSRSRIGIRFDGDQSARSDRRRGRRIRMQAERAATRDVEGVVTQRVTEANAEPGAARAAGRP